MSMKGEKWKELLLALLVTNGMGRRGPGKLTVVPSIELYCCLLLATVLVTKVPNAQVR